MMDAVIQQGEMPYSKLAPMPNITEAYESNFNRRSSNEGESCQTSEGWGIPAQADDIYIPKAESVCRGAEG